MHPVCHLADHQIVHSNVLIQKVAENGSLLHRNDNHTMYFKFLHGNLAILIVRDIKP